MEIEELLADSVKTELRDQIVRVKKEYCPSKCAQPFVPYVGHEYANAKRRILIVGKATEGWGWNGEVWDKSASLQSVDVDNPHWFAELRRLPHEFIERKVAPYYGGEVNCNEGYCSSFWNKVYRLACVLLCEHPIEDYKREPEMSQHCFGSIAWSNVFKLSKVRGNPGRELLSIQKESRLLHKEIEILAPDVILFSTGRSYDAHLKRCLSNIERLTSVSADYKSIERVEGIGKIALRTKHLQAMSNCEFKQVVEYLKHHANVRANRRSPEIGFPSQCSGN